MKPIAIDIDDIIDSAIESAAYDLQQNHIWENRTGDMESSISASHLHLEIDVPYATYVDYYKPYLSELEDNLIENIIENVEMEWSNL